MASERLTDEQLDELRTRSDGWMIAPFDHGELRWALDELATIRRDGHAPPGKVLVDADVLSHLVWCAAGGTHCAGEMCSAYKHCDQTMVAAYPEQTCRNAWLAHLGLSPHLEAKQ